MSKPHTNSIDPPKRRIATPTSSREPRRLSSYNPNMATFKEITVTLQGGYTAYARYWTGPTQKGAILYHHGIQSHCDWYESSAAALADAGYAVLQIDRRGCGQNDKDRGHADSADQLIEDDLAARAELLRRSGFGACHLVGISWGGKLVVATHVRHPESVKSLSLVTPGLFPRVGVSKKEMARIGFAMLYEPEKLFDIPLDDADLFTSDAKWKDFINTDERTLHQCTAGFYLASRRMDRIVSQLAKSPRVPIHLFIASDERIIDNNKTTSFIRDLHWPATRITTYENARHSLEFENDPTHYFTDLVDFINQAN